MEWDTSTQRMRQIERRVIDFGSKLHGQTMIVADRLADMLEQIDQLRGQIKHMDVEVKRIAEKQEKIAKYVKENVKPQKEDGDDRESK